MNQSDPPSFTFFKSISFKIIVIGLLVLVMLIPGALIRNLIREREAAQQAVIAEIGSKWGGGQWIAGPVLSIPYYAYFEKDGVTFREVQHAHFLPETLNIHAKAIPEIRYRGIYKTVVYQAELHFHGRFRQPAYQDLKLSPENMLFDEAFLQVGITDMRGIQDDLEIQWNEERLKVNPGIPVQDISNSGFHAGIGVSETGENSFRFRLILNGSEILYFIPTGKVSRVKLESGWAHPKFDGAFLPDERTIGEEGFTASWKVLHLNRNYPQSWKNSAYQISESAFGALLILPVDQYQKTMRSAKYAIMFIALTFMIFLFVEILNRQRVHPIQYLLVGLSISIFYVLLLSLAEQIGFNLAYGVSSAATMVLISAYGGGIFRSWKTAMLLFGALLLMYLFLFTLIQLTDYSLLMGSVGLFLVMAMVMYASRRVDWYPTGADTP